MKYNYLEAVKEDVNAYINENINLEDYDSVEDLEEHLNVVLWVNDSVTGNASGSYTFNRYEAEGFVKENFSLAIEAFNEFSESLVVLAENVSNEDWERLDVIIRLYLLPQAISEVLEDLF